MSSNEQTETTSETPATPTETVKKPTRLQKAILSTTLALGLGVGAGTLAGCSTNTPSTGTGGGGTGGGGGGGAPTNPTYNACIETGGMALFQADPNIPNDGSTTAALTKFKDFTIVNAGYYPYVPVNAMAYSSLTSLQVPNAGSPLLIQKVYNDLNALRDSAGHPSGFLLNRDGSQVTPLAWNGTTFSQTAGSGYVMPNLYNDTARAIWTQYQIDLHNSFPKGAAFPGLNDSVLFERTAHVTYNADTTYNVTNKASTPYDPYGTGAFGFDGYPDKAAQVLNDVVASPARNRTKFVAAINASGQRWDASLTDRTTFLPDILKTVAPSLDYLVEADVSLAVGNPKTSNYIDARMGVFATNQKTGAKLFTIEAATPLSTVEANLKTLAQSVYTLNSKQLTLGTYITGQEQSYNNVGDLTTNLNFTPDVCTTTALNHPYTVHLPHATALARDAVHSGVVAMEQQPMVARRHG